MLDDVIGTFSDVHTSTMECIFNTLQQINKCDMSTKIIAIDEHSVKEFKSDALSTFFASILKQ